MKTNILSIAHQLKVAAITTDEAKNQLLILFSVVGRSEQLANFCTCNKSWGVNGRCVACEMPIKIS